MKKILTFTIVLLLSLNGMAQVFKTGEVLKPGNVTIGITPVYFTEAESFGTYFHVGYGLSSKVDIAARYGLLDGKDLLGADVEFNLTNDGNFAASLSAGGHLYFGDPSEVDDIFGLDGTLTLSYSFNRNGFEIYSGLDADIDFMDDYSTTDPDDKTSEAALWLPVGFNFNITDNLEFAAEADISLSDYGHTFLGGGLIFYFK